ERAHSPARLEPDDEVRDERSDQERGEDRERAAAEERGEQRERERGADEQPGELDRPQRQVGALEQELEVSPLPAVPEGVLGRAEEAVEDLEPLAPRPLLQRAP